MEKNITIILVVLILCFFILMTVLLASRHNLQNDNIKDSGKYYGPVQEGYDEQLFRDTGKYEKIEVNIDGN